MTERAEALARLQQALLDATLQAPDCTRDHLAQALMALDPDLTQAQVHCCSTSTKTLCPKCHSFAIPGRSCSCLHTLLACPHQRFHACPLCRRQQIASN